MSRFHRGKTFRCDRAERLLNLLQERVRSGSLASGLVSRSTSERPTQEGGNQDNNFVLTSSRSNHSLTRQLSAEPGAAVTVTGAAAMAHQVRLSSLPNNGGEGGTTHPPEYANVNCNDGVLAVEDSKGYLVPNTPDRGNFNNNNNNDVFDEMPREYENVCPTSVPPAAVPDHVLLSSINGGVHIPPMLPPKPPVPQANATAIGSQDESSNTSATSAITGAMAAAEDSALPPPEEADEPRQINYIAVDFKSTASPASPLSKLPPPPSSPSPATSNQPPSELRGAYCTIDIDRTKALSTTAKQQSQRVADPAGAAAASDSPVGVRKTRHNSTLQELAQVASHVGGVGKRNSLID